MSKRFTKVVEDFTCLNCDLEIKGSGYTNHCPHCLWSMHVDVNPGDRAEDCGGMMEPISIVVQGGNIDIVHQCTVCQAQRKNKTAPSDNHVTILSLMEGRY